MIRRLREEQGRSPAELAALAGLEQAMVEQIEDAEIDPPWAAVAALARALGASVESIAGAAAELRPE